MINIFAKRAFLNTSPNTEFVSKKESYHGRGHLQRVSSMIRGDQIAEKLGANLNPENWFYDDVAVYVKPHLKKGMDFNFGSSRSYIDIIDGHQLGDLLLKHPEVGVIVCSQADYETMSKALPKNKIVLIPQHHCNFERFRRERKGIKRIGVIGEENAFDYLPDGLSKELDKRGIELVKCYKFFSRKDIIDFYMSIDLQIVWRPYKKRLSNPLKIVNAASFGIPTIALDEKAFWEVDGCYLPVSNKKELLEAIDRISKSKELYEAISDNCIASSEKYHIDNIAELYKKL